MARKAPVRTEPDPTFQIAGRICAAGDSFNATLEAIGGAHRMFRILQQSSDSEDTLPVHFACSFIRVHSRDSRALSSSEITARESRGYTRTADLWDWSTNRPRQFVGVYIIRQDGAESPGSDGASPYLSEEARRGLSRILQRMLSPFIFLALLFAFIRVIRGLSPLQKLRPANHADIRERLTYGIGQPIDQSNLWGFTS
jgi:hypothetical protein